MPRTAAPQPFSTAEVAAVFAAYPAPIRDALERLRSLIFEAADETGAGPLDETLKWGQPSYLTGTTKSGSTIRIDRVKQATDQYALYVHCQTDLIETFRQLYPDSFAFAGNRSIVFRLGALLPEAELRHCLALALTYHRRKKA